MKMLKDANNMLASNKSAFQFIYLRKLHIDMEKKRAAAYPPPLPCLFSPTSRHTKNGGNKANRAAVGKLTINKFVGKGKVASRRISSVVRNGHRGRNTSNE
jgi:hypothetical protein